MERTNDTILDLAGIGAGPFNLSVAALLAQKKHINARFFESREHFSWHPGLLLDNTNMQTMFLKDLVSAVCPENPYSFLSYLVKNKKFYRFLSAELSCISRHEFSDYLAWVAHQLDNVQFSSRIEHVEFTGDHFELHTSQGKVAAKNLCIGTGKVPFIPDCATAYIGERVFHAAEIGLRQRDFTGKRIAIVGGGQSGADIFLNVLRGKWGNVASLDWISRRSNFQPLDEAAFTNEFFTPDYVDAFVGLAPEVRQAEVQAQKLTSDGVTQKSLLEIYQELYYRFDVLKEDKWVRLLPHRTLNRMYELQSGFELETANALSSQSEVHDADIVILATGFQSPYPACLDAILPLLELDEQQRYKMSPDFELKWSGSASNKIFAVNAGMHSHGIAEPQLSLMAWRSARIINCLAQEPLYDLDAGKGMIEWTTPSKVHESLSV
ncbi:lysine N(6)-hydroxylase/L-ornithine N(5)-oxygenase family protein [Vibrio coralliilyticus]|uniref:lysine N(6)-hydroxylase/L-ornithine N(5)-oxygenase family protein n=1 Tax=Vibrio coralliilyticus TaxID=190893 RepID=UPI00155FAF7D|nr:SidA/IucD/PvdA family monooxygenase [Vibrio coralliilyticus]NRF29967.1 SidA/IucD/PvdA family monooxygenase [Vibrio coralliilyticus]NRF51225.1 SidA/IucD/PvdA family monooxygenase [Vibrio coralliilyticus]NRG02066.1 SidA/IucD/PvdA family monooxygenase [Vibrio coralliilyticus]